MRISEMIYHMCLWENWNYAKSLGFYEGSNQDQSDGFIHFSTAAQVRGSAAKHQKGQQGLILLTVDSYLLSDKLKWEQGSGEALYPHLYGPLSIDAVHRVDDLPLDKNGVHVFPPHVPEI